MAPLLPNGDYDPCSPRANNTTTTTSTPPWYPSQILQSKSSMRSTLSAPNGLSTHPYEPVLSTTPTNAQRKLPTPRSVQNFINPQNLFKEPPPVRPAWTPINGSSPAEIAARAALRLLDRPSPMPVQYPKTPTNSTIFQANYQRVIPDFDIDMNEIEAEEELLENRTTVLRLNQDWQVDKADGRMYHIGHQPGAAYSGTLANDDPDHIDIRALEKIAKLEEQWARPQRLARSKELFHLANEYIHHGKSLQLQRTSFVVEGESVICQRPGCEKALAANVYYLCMGEDTCFCLHCFEMLWEGKCTGGLPDRFGTPKAHSRRDSAVNVEIPQLDGVSDIYFEATQRVNGLQSTPEHQSPVVNVEAPKLYDELHRLDLKQSSLMQSMHAFSDDEIDPPPPVCTPKRSVSRVEQDLKDLPDSPGSLGSTDSNGKWRHPPTRFQELHAHIVPGATLSETDKAALALWKLVSMEQRRWNGHLARSDARRAFQAGESSEDLSVNITAVTPDDTVEEEALMAITGLRKKDCQGRDLSEVLKEAAYIQKQKLKY